MGPEIVVLDDRLLIEELLVGLPEQHPKREIALWTTTYFYYRACRAAVLGAGGHLSGPFEQLHPVDQERAILSLLELRDDLSLPDPRQSVPAMARVAGRHPDLDLLNIEAVAVAKLLAATLWLSPEVSRGILPSVLDDEGIAWKTIAIPH